ncbi:hypothetical protein GCM10022405_41380 [Gibbsiella dentisursi]|uniref:Uncharacterized protein n=1 Tax=Gibbsiella dentisursi TaxID=796890 RepID=A0ABP7M4H6_9GAMM
MGVPDLPGNAPHPSPLPQGEGIWGYLTYRGTPLTLALSHRERGYGGT